MRARLRASVCVCERGRGRADGRTCRRGGEGRVCASARAGELTGVTVRARTVRAGGARDG